MIKGKGVYSRHTKVAALAAVDRHGGNLYKAHKETGISEATLSRWVKARQNAPELFEQLPAPQDNTPLDVQLERVARQMVAVMPEKVEGATLQELARSLSIVLGTMNLARTEKENKGDVREKLTRLLDHYAAQRAEAGDSEPVHG